MHQSVRSQQRTFKLGRLLSLDSQKQDVSQDELFNAVWNCLNCDLSEKWQHDIQTRIDSILRRWGDKAFRIKEEDGISGKSGLETELRGLIKCCLNTQWSAKVVAVLPAAFPVPDWSDAANAYPK